MNTTINYHPSITEKLDFFLQTEKINGLEKINKPTKDIISVFLLRSVFFVNTAIANTTTIQVIGAIKKSSILERMKNICRFIVV